MNLEKAVDHGGHGEHRGKHNSSGESEARCNALNFPVLPVCPVVKLRL